MDSLNPHDHDSSKRVDESWESTILHIDMDAFFLSVELLDAPQYRGVPALIAHDGPRSVVTSASYEARAFGIRSAMPLAHAKALCPHVVVIEPHREKYTAASARVMELLTTVTPQVEQLSIDEAFMDVAGARRLIGSPAQIAQQIKDVVRRETGLPSTVGVAANKSVAKIVSTYSKPEGLGVVPAHKTREYLNPLPVNVIWGVGPKLAERFFSANIHTVGDLARQDKQKMQRWIGAVGPQLVDLAQGIDPRPVETSQVSKSVGIERTFDEDITNSQLLGRELLGLAYECARRLRAENFYAQAISVKVKDNRRSNRTKTLSPGTATNSGAQIHEIAQQLLTQLMSERWHPVRLLGVRGEKLTTERITEVSQESLFDLADTIDSAASDSTIDLNRHRKTDQVLDQIRHKFPSATLKPARLLDRTVKSSAEHESGSEK